MERTTKTESNAELAGIKLPYYNEILRRLRTDFPPLLERRDVVDISLEHNPDFPRADWTI